MGTLQRRGLMALLTIACFSAHAAEVQVAVAANFAVPLERIAAGFSAATGHTLKVAAGSTGKFYSQIIAGAPFELLIAADDETPKKLIAAGQAVAGSNFTYAIGKLVLWSAKPGFVDDQGAVLGSGRFSHLAIADPKVAPYGAAALQVIKARGLAEALAPKLVTGQSIAQAFQFVGTGNAELGFVALSQVIAAGRPKAISAPSGWRRRRLGAHPCRQAGAARTGWCRRTLYGEIRQDAVLLKPGADNPAAKALLAYLKSPAAQQVIRAFGYGIDTVTPEDWSAVRLTAQLAALTTLLLLIIGTPIGWWLARTRSRFKPLVASVVTMPLVLPPTVLGFYLLLLMGPQGPIGQLTQALGLGRLPFTFAGLVVASVIYSMPFVVQPLQQAFEAIPERTLEAAATLRAGPWDRFFSVVLPLARPGFLTASVLGFAHTVGEFGVVLMIGGNIPGVTRVLSVAIYGHVEALEFEAAHRLAGGMVVFAMVVLVALYMLSRPTGRAAQGAR